MARSAFVTTKPRKGSKRWYVAKLDEKVRRIVKLQEPGCITCPETRPAELELSHFWRRGFEQTRFDVDPAGNNHTQCRRCNRKHGRDREPYERWFTQRFGPAAHAILATLNYRAHSQEQFDIFQLEELLQKLTAQLKALTDRRREARSFMSKPYDNDVPF